MYTWYVNSSMEVQVYEGAVNPYLIYDFLNEQEASEHKIQVDTEVNLGQRYKTGFDNPRDVALKSLYAKCKYYIPKEYAETFFIMIGESSSYMVFDYGVTDVDLGDLLD